MNDTQPLPDALPLGDTQPLGDARLLGDTQPLPLGDTLLPVEEVVYVEPPQRPGRRPRRWLRIVVALGVVALLIAAAEIAIRLIVPGIVANGVRDALHLSEEHAVEVRLGAFEVPAAVTGRLSDVSVEVDDAELIKGLTGNVRLHAGSVPMNFRTGEIRGANASLTVGREQLPSAIALLTSGVAESGSVQGGELEVSRGITIFGMDVTLRATLGLSVDRGDVVVVPKGVGVAGFDLNAEQLHDMTGGTLDAILQPHDVCVRDRLPAGIELTGIDLLSTGAAKLTVDIAPDILSDPAQLETGSC